jgi:hypothetical protein
MPRLRYNITGALGAILFVAVGFAALREADELWDSWLFSLTLGLLLFAVLLAAHRTGDRRAFWIGFTLFGWGYLSFTLIPSTEPKLISTKALAYLQQLRIFGIRAYRMRAVPDLDRMRAHNVSSNDLIESLTPTRLVSDNVLYEDFMRVVEQKADSPAQFGQASQTVAYVVSWGTRDNKPEQYENIILKADPDGAILRLKDVAKVELESSSYSYIPRVGPGTAEKFIHIGHSLFALLAAWLGGVLSHRLRSASETPGNR